MLELIYGEDLNTYKKMGREAEIPACMVEPLYFYVQNHVRPGHFLTAVLCNDLKESIRHADYVNEPFLGGWISMLTWCVPDKCWGSPEAVAKWLENKSHEAEEKA